eukprot:TRINITY_DN2888_c0_g3_i2.p1 TRINITY_DN2888_c0_g3~~TRINITY_DN2888_c0_g3_i2.p1  ORF type:complete len:215 (-),score=79.15 TRINITY_DN2888_c0_g3_i2:115-759(-)
MCIRDRYMGAKGIEQLIISKFSSLEDHLNKRLDSIQERLLNLEEKHDKGVSELVESLQREVYNLRASTMKGYYSQNNAGTFVERSMAMRPDLEKATGVVDSISEKSEEGSEADPLEELLKKGREKKAFGINLRENHKGAEGKEDPIMALLMQDSETAVDNLSGKSNKNEEQSKEVAKTSEEKSRPTVPRNRMFHVNKGKSENNPPSMDDLLFGD